MKLKHKLNIILVLSTSLIYILLIYIGVEKQNVELGEVESYEGIVTDRGITIREGSKGKKSIVFFLSLQGLDRDLGIYRMNKDYDDLFEIIKTGDILKVYYNDNTNKKEKINIDLIQVEKGNVIIVDKKEYQKKESFLIYAGLAGIIITFIIAYKTYKHYKQQSVDNIEKDEEESIIYRP